MSKTQKIGTTEIKGLREVTNNLNREIDGIKNRSMKGIIEAAILIRRDMENTSPLIPVDTGNLRSSWFIVTAMGVKQSNPNFVGENAKEMSAEHQALLNEAKTMIPQKIGLVMGFSANYAAPVHEMVGDVQWKRPGSGAKYLESALSRNYKQILETIRRNVQV